MRRAGLQVQATRRATCAHYSAGTCLDHRGTGADGQQDDEGCLRGSERRLQIEAARQENGNQHSDDDQRYRNALS